MKKIIILIVITAVFSNVFSQLDTIPWSIKQCLKDSSYMEKVVKYQLAKKKDTDFVAVTTSVKYLFALMSEIKLRKSIVSQIIKTDILVYFLNVGHYPRVDVFKALKYFEKSDFNYIAKQRLLELLNGQYSDKEFKLYLDYEKKVFAKNIYKLDKRFYDRRINEAIKKTNQTYEKARDSIYDQMIENEFKGIVKKVKYDKDILLTVGWLDLVEALPIILKQLEREKKNKEYPQDIARLVIARLGDKNTQKELFEKYGKSILKEKTYGYNYMEVKKALNCIMYICTTESADLLRKSLYSKSKYLHFDFELHRPLTDHFIYPIKALIVNYPYNYTKIMLFLDDEKAINEALENTKIWMEKNKGNYVLNRDLFVYP